MPHIGAAIGGSGAHSQTTSSTGHKEQSIIELITEMRSEYERLIVPGATGLNPLRSAVVGVGQPSYLFGESAVAPSMINDEELGQTLRVDASIQEFKYGASTAVGAAGSLSLLHQHSKKFSHYNDDDLVDN